MITVGNLRLPLGFDEDDLTRAAAKALSLKTSEIKSVSVFRKSVDARRKSDIRFCCTALVCAENEDKILAKNPAATKYSPPARLSLHAPDRCGRPVVIGFGPAGMFAALALARAGAKPVVLERGEPVEKRAESVRRFLGGGQLDPESNVQFGEGGAGTFSDGKLTTGIKNPLCGQILRDFVRFGADERILIDAKPHIGTDNLTKIVKNIRNEIIALGGEVRFSQKAEDFIVRSGRLCGIKTESGEIECSRAILATGHSARDIFETLRRATAIERKPFSIGFRIEHRREFIDRALYGDFAGRPELSAADYKLAAHLPDGRGVYSFCMCPGGVVINASSERGGAVVNGMSFSRRDGVNSNSAILTDLLPADLPGEDPLAGVYFQREIEKRAFDIQNGAMPCETVGAFLGTGENKPSGVVPSVAPEACFTRAEKILPEKITDRLAAGLRLFDRKIAGFCSPDAVLTLPETRSSSPVRIVRGEDGQCEISGLFPCGEGAGYAGGIMSAAADGVSAARRLILSLGGTEEFEGGKENEN